jgi:RNA polymerase sigma factor (sigma-70 family)
MEVRSQRGEGELAEHGSNGSRGRPPGSEANGGLSAEHAGVLLGNWQARELRIARGFAECRGLSAEQLEDLYQETALALLTRAHRDERHLRGALRMGLKHRALKLHRDERRRGAILASSAPSLHRIAQAREARDGPEGATLAREDRLIVSEFLTELSELELRVFWLMAEGMRYRAIAPVLGIQTNEARNAARSCERKRERFQLLHDAGRLCGFRSATIRALVSGAVASEELAARACAHLEVCAHCRAEHKTNARRLRRSFQGRASALLPLPVMIARIGWLERLGARARNLHQRVPSEAFVPGPGVGREGAMGVLLGGAAVKVAAGVATVAVVAGSAITAGRVAEHPRTHRVHDAARATSEARRPGETAPAAPSTPLPEAPASEARAQPSHTARVAFGPGRVVALPAAASTPVRAGASSVGIAEATGVSAGRAASSTERAGGSHGGPFSP